MILNEKFIAKHTGLNVKVVESCRSTFDEIGKYDAIIAKKQTEGVGRGDHSYFCPDGGLYIVMRVQGVFINPHTLTPAVGLAVHDTIQAILGLYTQIKWVNDIMYNFQKVAGILCKCVRKAEYLVGIGINYATDPEVLEKAGLSDVAGSLQAPESRATAFVTGLLRQIKRAAIATFDNERYGRLCMNVCKTVGFTYNGVYVEGYAESVTPDGALIVRIGNATVAVDSGEVSILRNIDGAVILDEDNK